MQSLLALTPNHNLQSWILKPRLMVQPIKSTEQAPPLSKRLSLLLALQCSKCRIFSKTQFSNLTPVCRSNCSNLTPCLNVQFLNSTACARQSLELKETRISKIWSATTCRCAVSNPATSAWYSCWLRVFRVTINADKV